MINSRSHNWDHRYGAITLQSELIPITTYGFSNLYCPESVYRNPVKLNCSNRLSKLDLEAAV
jgi:hypothetical protein